MKPRDSQYRLQIAASLLNTLKPGRLLDLGCGHGSVAIVAQTLGWQVTAVDVRTRRMPSVDGIRWVQADVREFPIRKGEYDCILLLGLVYHLELKDVLDLLHRCASTTTIVDTHVSLAPNHEEMGYRGQLHDEIEDRTPEQHAASATLSWGNLESFWPDEESLMRIFTDVGFASVLKLSPSYRADRTFYLCLPPSDVELDVSVPPPSAKPKRKSLLPKRAKKSG